MSTEENTATIRRSFDGLNKLNVAGLDDVCTPDFKLHVPGAPGARPREAAKQAFGMFFAPDVGRTPQWPALVACVVSRPDQRG